MAGHEGLLEALATLASLDGINDDDVRDCALTAIERLTKEESTRSVMASHAGIMAVLARATFQKGGVMEEFDIKGTSDEEDGDSGVDDDDDDGDYDDDHSDYVSADNGFEGRKYLAKSALKNLAETL